MIGRYIGFVLSLVLVSASSAQQMKTSNKFVSGIIEPGTGLITIRKAPGLNTSPILSFPQKSFLTVMIGDKIYTNNNVGTNVGSHPSFGGLLQNGVNQKIADTVRTTWSNINSCDVIQEVYPVEMEASGQIVMRWRIKNKGTTTVASAVQFLLDLQVGDQNPNDGAPILTRYGYRPTWQMFKHDSGAYGLPWFFAAFENILPNSPTFEPGIAGSGYNQDVNFKLGLKRPKLMVVGDWGVPLGNALVDPLWGIPSSVQWGSPYKDAAIFFQWNTTNVAGNTTAELGSTSYGTPEFGLCYGQLMGVVFYPRRYRWQPPKYEPDTANIEFYAFNVYSPNQSDPNFGPPSTNTYLKLHCGPNLRITSPGTGKTHLQKTQPLDGLIAPHDVGHAIWKVVADKVTNCKSNVTSWLKFTAQSSLSGTGPIFFNSGDGDTCEHSVIVDCIVIDTLTPIVENVDTIPLFSRSFDARDDRTLDRGIEDIAWTGIALPGKIFDMSKFQITITPPLTPCSKDTHHIEVKQLDSTKGGCLDFMIVDCGANDTTIRVCFEARTYVPPVDSVAPIITMDTSNRRSIKIVFSDKGVDDRGVDSLLLMAGFGTDLSKFSISTSPFMDSCSKLQHTVRISQLDTTISGCFWLWVEDCADNHSISPLYCFEGITGSVDDVPSSESCELIGNPATGMTMLRIRLAASESVDLRIVDIAGRVVRSERLGVLGIGTNDIPIVTNYLSEGTYYVIAEFGGRQYAKKLQVIK